MAAEIVGSGEVLHLIDGAHVYHVRESNDGERAYVIELPSIKATGKSPSETRANLLTEFARSPILVAASRWVR